MRERALIHIAGPVGAGKTTFIERLLDAGVALSICVRAERDAKLRKEQASAPQSHAELRRYLDAGASDVALYRFAEPNMEAFFMSDFMQDYSEAVFIEGDCPIDHVDLSVFVAPAPAEGRALLRRVAGAHAPWHHALFDRRSDAPAPAEHWALERGYAGVERAQLVVVNVRSGADGRAAESFVADIARLRQDEDVFRDVVGFGGSKLPVAALIADLTNAKDAGLKKAVARVKRTTRRRSR